jgi:hypothetical protein
MSRHLQTIAQCGNIACLHEESFCKEKIFDKSYIRQIQRDNDFPVVPFWGTLHPTTGHPQEVPLREAVFVV